MKGSKARWIFIGVFKEMWYDIVRMDSETIERKFCKGQNLYGLAWCMYSAYPPCKGKGHKGQCSNSRGISLLRIVGKQYGRVSIKNLWASWN